MAESVVARAATIPEAIRRGAVVGVPPDRAGFVIVVDLADNVACPVCGEAHAIFELVQHIDRAGATSWSYQCVTCPRAAVATAA